jgi:hypothetical protein
MLALLLVVLLLVLLFGGLGLFVAKVFLLGLLIALLVGLVGGYAGRGHTHI